MKKKLTIDEQIEDLKKKGVTFEIMCEEDAKKFLRYNNYYFKLKSYAKNYPINPKNGKYVNLEFAYLVELSKLDMYLRKIILGMCLDVEHILKTRMLYDVSQNEKEDGYNIVKKYLWAYPNTKIEILQKANSYNFTSDLAEKHSLDEEYSVWHKRGQYVSQIFIFALVEISQNTLVEHIGVESGFQVKNKFRAVYVFTRR